MSARKYSNEFKEEAVRLMVIDGLSGVEVEEKLGVNRNRLYEWKSKLGHNIALTKDLSGASAQELAKEVKRLKRELSKSEEMNTILKKTIVFFGKGN